MSEPIILVPLTDKETCILIEEVKKQPCLYAKDHPKYFDCNHKMATWNAIARRVYHKEWSSYTKKRKVYQVDELVNQWRTMRMLFKREFILKKKKSKKNGRLVAFRTYHYFNDLMFLKPHEEIASTDLEKTTDSSSDEDNLTAGRPSLGAGVKTYSRTRQKTFQLSDTFNKPNSPERGLTSIAETIIPTTSQDLPSTFTSNPDNGTIVKEEPFDMLCPKESPIDAILETVKSSPGRDDIFEATETIIFGETWNPVIDNNARFCSTGHELPSCSPNSDNINMVEEESLARTIKIERPNSAQGSNKIDTMIESPVDEIREIITHSPVGDDMFQDPEPTIFVDTENTIVDCGVRLSTNGLGVPSCSSTNSDDINMVEKASLARTIKKERRDSTQSSNVIDTLIVSSVEASNEIMTPSPERDDLFQVPGPTIFFDTGNSGVDSGVSLSTTGLEVPSSSTINSDDKLMRVEKVSNARLIKVKKPNSVENLIFNTKNHKEKPVAATRGTEHSRPFSNTSKVTKCKIDSKNLYPHNGHQVSNDRPKQENWKRFVLSLVPMLERFPKHKILDAQIAVLSTLQRHLSSSDDTNGSSDSDNMADEDDRTSSQNNGDIGTKSNEEIKTEQCSDDDEMR